RIRRRTTCGAPSSSLSPARRQPSRLWHAACHVSTNRISTKGLIREGAAPRSLSRKAWRNGLEPLWPAYRADRFSADRMSRAQFPQPRLAIEWADFFFSLDDSFESCRSDLHAGRVRRRGDDRSQPDGMGLRQI